RYASSRASSASSRACSISLVALIAIAAFFTSYRCRHIIQSTPARCHRLTTISARACGHRLTTTGRCAGDCWVAMAALDFLSWERLGVEYVLDEPIERVDHLRTR